jgi:alkylation response protein AidB-like acyl-CoA dehydrogenase
MDLNFTAEEQEFRTAARNFIAANLPADIAEKVRNGLRLGKDDYVRWQKILYRQGWGATMWPQQYGGAAWNPVQLYIFDEECSAAGAPMQLPFGPKMVAPVIMAYGNRVQQEYFLPRIISGEDWWCQGYSEPNSGSDLASLMTRAERKGDFYIVNGQKAWTTFAHYADWIFCLVRTSTAGRQQAGISFLLIDMKTPGVTVRPVILLDGEHEINEVWLENVKVPAQNLVGEENKGWTYAKFLLGHERTDIARVGRSKAALQRLKRIARNEVASDRPLLEDQRFRDRIALVELELMALEVTNLRVLLADSKTHAPGPESSILKIKGSEIEQMLTELMMQALGHYALPWIAESLDSDREYRLGGGDYAGSLSGQYFNCRKTSIYGGSNEIQRNIIAQMILGL